MENPYWRVLGNTAMLAVTPLDTFIHNVLMFGFIHIASNSMGEYWEYRFLFARLALTVGLGSMSWRRGFVEAALLYSIGFLPFPAITSRLLPLDVALRIAIQNFKPGVVRYFQFLGTDENNLSVIMSNIAPMTAFFVVTSIAPVFRALWTYKGWILCLFVATGLLVSSPSLRQFILIRWASKLAWMVLRWLLRTYFYIIDTATAAAHGSSRMVESWEHKRAKTSVEALSPYEYSPLDPQRREIRILRLRQRTTSPEIECEFMQTSVDDPPPFEAVSYTWGGETASEHIVVDGRRLAVSPTVCKWLRYRRSFFSEAYLWIDAICIDQANGQEKASQIPLMGDIYSRAGRTIIWLAHPSEVHDSHEARSLLMTLAYLASIGASVANLQYVVRTDQNMEALSRLLSRNYFHRVWIVQEVALAKLAHVSYGNVVLSWDSLSQAAGALFDSHLIGSMARTSEVADGFDPMTSSIPSRHIANITGISRLRASCQQGNRLDMLYVLASMEDFAATIPHDKLFGFLGMIDELPASLAHPDYKEPVERLFARTTRHLLYKTNSVSLLQMAGSGFSRRLELPSWVPDFTQGYIGRRRRVDDAVSGLRGPDPDPDEDGVECDGTDWNILRVHYREIDTIKTVQPAVAFQPFSSNDIVWTHDSQDLWKVKSKPTQQSAETVAGHFRKYFEEYLAWHDEVVSLAEADPKVGEKYPGDLTSTLFRTMCCNDAQLTDGTEEQDVGLLRYTTVMAVTRVICQLYQSPLTSDVKAMNEVLLERFEMTAMEWAQQVDPEVNHFFYWMGASSFGKRFCIMESGRIGMLPPGSQVGDIVSYIRGQTIPFVLRRSDEHDGFTELVGGCYVHGLPDVPNTPDTDPWSEASII